MFLEVVKLKDNFADQFQKEIKWGRVLTLDILCKINYNLALLGRGSWAIFPMSMPDPTVNFPEIAEAIQIKIDAFANLMERRPELINEMVKINGMFGSWYLRPEDPNKDTLDVVW